MRGSRMNAFAGNVFYNGDNLIASHSQGITVTGNAFSGGRATMEDPKDSVDGENAY